MSQHSTGPINHFHHSPRIYTLTRKARMMPSPLLRSVVHQINMEQLRQLGWKRDPTGTGYGPSGEWQGIKVGG